MAERDAKLTFGGGKQILGVQKAPGDATNLKEKPEKSGDLFLFVLETVKILYLVRAPFEFNGRAPFKLVTPLPPIPPNGANPPPQIPPKTSYLRPQK